MENGEGKNEDKTAMEYATQLVKSSKQIVLLCGAGISTNSNIPDFKTLYSKDKHLKKALTRSSYKKHLSSLSNFLLSFHSVSLNPTPTHQFIKRLDVSERLRRCYTMNIDGLERKVGVSDDRLVELHGTLESGGRCGKHQLSEEAFQNALATSLAEYAKIHGCTPRPNIVFYGEVPHGIENMKTDVSKSDLVICIGTSLSVAPASNILPYAQEFHVPVIIVDKDEKKTKKTKKREKHIFIMEDCDEICKQWI